MIVSSSPAPLWSLPVPTPAFSDISAKLHAGSPLAPDEVQAVVDAVAAVAVLDRALARSELLLASHGESEAAVQAALSSGLDAVSAVVSGVPASAGYDFAAAGSERAALAEAVKNASDPSAVLGAAFRFAVSLVSPA